MMEYEKGGRIPKLGSVQVKNGHCDCDPLTLAIAKDTEATHREREPLGRNHDDLKYLHQKPENQLFYFKKMDSIGPSKIVCGPIKISWTCHPTKFDIPDSMKLSDLQKKVNG